MKRCSRKAREREVAVSPICPRRRSGCSEGVTGHSEIVRIRPLRAGDTAITRTNPPMRRGEVPSSYDVSNDASLIGGCEARGVLRAAFAIQAGNVADIIQLPAESRRW